MGKVMKLINHRTGLMECIICGARHYAAISTGGYFKKGTWQCINGCSTGNKTFAEYKRIRELEKYVIKSIQNSFFTSSIKLLEYAVEKSEDEDFKTKVCIEIKQRKDWFNNQIDEMINVLTKEEWVIIIEYMIKSLKHNTDFVCLTPDSLCQCINKSIKTIIRNTKLRINKDHFLKKITQLPIEKVSNIQCLIAFWLSNYRNNNSYTELLTLLFNEEKSINMDRYDKLSKIIEEGFVPDDSIFNIENK